MRERLEELLLTANIGEPLVRQLAKYGEAVLERGRQVNLTGAKTPEALTHHVLDSLTLLPYLAAGGEAVCYIDVGSGAGFPAIPLALASGFPMTLIEATAKKATFLQEMLQEFELAGEVLGERAELVGRDPDYRERFNRGTIRAVGSAATSAELLLPFIAPGGLALLQRGRVDAGEREALAGSALMLGAELVDILDVAQSRSIAVVRKLRATPMRFPRRAGIAQKRPLCE